MTKSGRKAGSIIALIGGTLIIIAIVIQYGAFQQTSNNAFIIAIIVNFALMALAIVGAILLLVDKTIGGILPISVGVFIIFGNYIMLPGVPNLTIPLAYVDTILLILGGIVGIVVGSEL